MKKNQWYLYKVDYENLKRQKYYNSVCIANFG